MNPSASTIFAGHPNRIVLCLLFLVLAVLGTIGIERTPPLWWDEGWTLCVARTWVEQGHYGCLLNGVPAAPILSGHWPVVAPVAASFSLFGVGIWQARIPSLAYTLLTFSLCYLLMARLYNRSIAIGTLFVLLCLPLDWNWHPIIMGRQVLGEIPMIGFLLAGYYCFLFVERHRLWLVAASLCWALALMTKSQTVPFWTASMLCPLLIVFWRREWRSVRRLAIGAIGAVVCWCGLDWARALLLAGQTSSSAYAQARGLTEAAAMSFVPSTRLAALTFAGQYAVPALCGYGYGAWMLMRRLRTDTALSTIEVVRIMLLAVGGSWLVWFIGFSVGWDRYAFPIFFLAAAPIAVLAYDLTNGFDLGFIRSKFWSLVAGRRWDGATVKLIAVVVLAAYMGLTSLYRGYLYSRWSDTDTSAVQVAEFLNRSTPAHSLVETYESELFLFLNRPYHYPPAQLNVEMIRRDWQGGSDGARYDWLGADPDYLVIGNFGRWLGQYKSLVEAGKIRHVQTVGRYEVYQRCTVTKNKETFSPVTH